MVWFNNCVVGTVLRGPCTEFKIDLVSINRAWVVITWMLVIFYFILFISEHATIIKLVTIS
jgi:hypothetical protein